jgi:hypothetical protein
MFLQATVLPEYRCDRPAGRLPAERARIDLRADQFLHPRTQLLDIILRMALRWRSTPNGLLNMLHASWFALNASAFFFAHVIELGQRLLDLRKHGGFEFALGCASGGIHAPGMCAG